jgi:predicted DNA-binding transcriptional regulator YafY
VTLNRSAQRLSRLLTLLSTLSETSRPMTARELREKIEGYGDSDSAFHANFSRDKRELRELGVEIDVLEVGDTDPPELGYRISRANYALRDPGLEPDEAAALQLAVSLVRLEGVEGGTSLWKIGGAPTATGGEPAGSADLPGDPLLAVLFAAVAERRVTRFAYRTGDDRRTVEPYRLQFARGRWYLLARDRDKGEERQFRLDRIVGVPETGPAGDFPPPSPDRLADVPDPWQLADGEPVTARVAVDGPQAELARRVLGEAAVAGQQGDRTVFELEVTHVDGFRSFVLGFLEHAEVLGPPELRSGVVEWLEDLA